MAPVGVSQTLLSPAELSFIHSSLSLTPPIRPDLRTPTQFRPLIAETDILATTNGSARICFNDGTEAIVGVKAEIEKTERTLARHGNNDFSSEARDGDVRVSSGEGPESAPSGPISQFWIEVSIEIPGYRDDDPLPVFLSSMITETLLAESALSSKLYLNDRWHWKLYIDILLLSPPLSYPLPLLSLTTHLALLDARLPRLTSEKEEDPMFDDDWAAAVPLYPQSNSPSSMAARPPVTLLVMTVGNNTIFDPSREELAVAEAVFAISVIASTDTSSATNPYRLLAIRSIDPPSRLTPPGVPNSINPATVSTGGDSGITYSGANAVSGAPTNAAQEVLVEKEKGNLWSPPRGGVKRSVIVNVIKMTIGKNGVASEVLEGLAGVEG